MDWFEEWEKETHPEWKTFYLEKQSVEDTASCRMSCTRGHSNRRESAWCRKHRYKTNQLHIFYRNTDSFYSYSLFHYYLPDERKPTHIKRIEGDFNRYVWAGPGYAKEKKRTSNRRIRHAWYDELPSKGNFLVKKKCCRLFD